MQVPLTKLKLSEVDWATESARHRIQATSERALKYLTDPDKKERRRSQQCVCCFYGDRIGGAAMTASFCGHCETELMSSSTNIDKLCGACAINLNLCRHCAASVELKTSRALRDVLTL